MVSPGQMFSSVSTSTSILVVAYIFLLRRISTLKSEAEVEWAYNWFSRLLFISILAGGISLLFGAILLFSFYDITLSSIENMEQEPTYIGVMGVTFIIQGSALAIGSIVLQWKEPV